LETSNTAPNTRSVRPVRSRSVFIAASNNVPSPSKTLPAYLHCLIIFLVSSR
jgi:hypothetical protein